jgi:hypothetical protein
MAGNCKGADGSGNWNDFWLKPDKVGSPVPAKGLLKIENSNQGEIDGHRMEGTSKDFFRGKCRLVGGVETICFVMTIDGATYLFSGDVSRDGKEVNGTYVVFSTTAVIKVEDARDPGDTGTWGGNQT